VLAIVTGLLALTAVYYTARNADTARRTFQLGEQGQVTDRYTKAIEQLGSDQANIRIGGIYALERIAADSARDHPIVMEVLTAFVRGAEVERTPPARPRPDVQAALTVIGRRTADHDTRDIDLSHTDLHGARMVGARLRHAYLAGVDLTAAGLFGARLTAATLTGARLASADLTSADLTGANLIGVDLAGANLSFANLTGADLTGAKLAGANLEGARLNGAYLGRVTGMSPQQIRRAAVTDASTKFGTAGS
jgi:uncharacterized protein YjbI with pentapeptide repeats